MHTATCQIPQFPGIEVISIASDRSFSRHTHDEFGFGYLASGRQKSWSGRGQVEACAGDVITVNPQELHDGVVRQGESRYWRMLFLTPDALASLTDLPAHRMEVENPVLHDAATFRQVKKLVDGIAAEGSELPALKEAAMLVLRKIFGSVVQESQPRRDQYSTAISRVLDRIKSETAESLSLADYAETAGMSRYQVLRRFHKEVGLTPHAYLTQHRIKLAHRNILAGKSLAEVAAISGFADQSHLTRVFVKQLGFTPGSLQAVTRGSSH